MSKKRGVPKGSAQAATYMNRLTVKVMVKKQYSVYQVILAYLFGRYQAYRENGLFQDIGFDDFVRLVCEAPIAEEGET